MAIQAPVFDPTAGTTVAAGYHRVTRVIIDYLGKTIIFSVSSWRSNAAWAAGASPITSVDIPIYPLTSNYQGASMPDFPTARAALLAAGDASLQGSYLYTLMLTLPAWSGGTSMA